MNPFRLFRLNTEVDMLAPGAAIVGLRRPLPSCQALIPLESLIPPPPDPQALVRVEAVFSVFPLCLPGPPAQP